MEAGKAETDPLIRAVELAFHAEDAFFLLE